MTYLKQQRKNGTSQKPVPFTIPVCSAYLFDDYPGNTYLEKGLKKSPKQTDRGGKSAKNAGNEFFKTRFKNAIITPARDKRNESQKCLNSERRN